MHWMIVLQDTSQILILFLLMIYKSKNKKGQHFNICTKTQVLGIINYNSLRFQINYLEGLLKMVSPVKIQNRKIKIKIMKAQLIKNYFLHKGKKIKICFYLLNNEESHLMNSVRLKQQLGDLIWQHQIEVQDVYLLNQMKVMICLKNLNIKCNEVT